jgi:sugar-specific transcriptional regulator TrmB
VSSLIQIRRTTQNIIDNAKLNVVIPSDTMKEAQIIEILTSIGLTEAEAAVYSAALALGPSSVLSIARAAEIKRTTVYLVLESLRNKGLVAIDMQGPKKRYMAENPERLEEVLSLKKAALHKALPELLSRYQEKSGGTITYYEGLESVKSAYENLLRDVRPGDEYLIVSNQERWLALDPEYFDDFRYRRGQLDLKIKMLLQETPAGHTAQKFQANYNMQVRFLPSDREISANFILIPCRVLLHQISAPTSAIAIENPEIIQLHREMFEAMWRSVK